MTAATAATRPPPIDNLQPPTGRTFGISLLALLDAAAVAAAISWFGRITPNTIVLVALAIWSLAIGNHYRLKLQPSVLDDMTGIAGRVVVAISLGAAYREFVSGHDVFTVDRLGVLVGSAAFVLVGRTITYAVLRLLRNSGRLRRSTVVVASSHTAAEIEEAIEADPGCGLATTATHLEFPLCSKAIDRLGVDVVIIEVADRNNRAVTDLVRQLRFPGPDVYLMPTALMHFPAAIPGADQVASLTLVPVRQAANRTLRWKLKRVIDVVLAVILLPLAGPIMAVAALILLAEGNRGVLFRQERIGLGGQPFVMYKLRTVTVSRATGDQMWSVNPELISPFARFCRATSIDELPQLWNVLRGDMSLVGPRPERPHFVQQFTQSVPDYANRHRVPVGLTGLAQVHGLRGDTSISVRSRFDNNYIDNWSLFEDVKILCRTVGSIVTLRGRGS